MGVSAEMRANDHLQVLGEVRLDQGRVLEAYGLFVRVRPWPARRFDIQAGRIPPTFGAMSADRVRQQQHPDRPAARVSVPDVDSTRCAAGHQRRSAAHARPRLAVELSRRQPDARPRAADGQHQPLGHRRAGARRHRHDRVDRRRSPRDRCRIRVSATTTAAVSWRAALVVRPTLALAFGVSASRGAWLDEPLETRSPARTPTTERGRSRLAATPSSRRARCWSAARRSARRGRCRTIATLHIDRAAGRHSMLIEGRYKIAPGFYVAMRGDRMDFSKIPGERGAAARGRRKPGGSKPASAIR